MGLKILMIMLIIGEADKIMNKLKGDSLLFAYYPDNKYLASSKIIGEKYKKINQSIA